MIEFEIDGKKLTSEPGKMVIEVADNAGIYIPRFCYHKKLSIAANCRMCLVEVEKSGKPLPACATPITAGMKVFTRSAKAIAAQRSVMEFLLINHPLDCPICDQGGECELQDLSMGYGNSISRYTQGKRSVYDKDLGPLVISFMTRCIQCTRCVRFGDEIAGMRELGAYNRGEHLEIGTYVERMMRSELSGNVIDVCPVGALCSKPYLYTARAWEMIQHPSIAPHDCVGSNIYVHTRGEEFSPVRNVMRVAPRANEAINEMWLSDRDRFSYEGLKSNERLLKPRLKINGQWQEVDWPTVLDFVANNLKKIINEHGAKQIGALASPNSTLEEFYLLQKFMRGIGSNNIDYRIRQLDFSAEQPIYPNLGTAIAELEKADTILLIGSFARQEQPLINHRIRKAALQGANVFVINPIDYQFNFDLAGKVIVGTELLPTAVAKLAKALGGNEIPNGAKTLLNKIEVDKETQTIAKKLKAGEKVAILLGPQALHHPHATTIQMLANFVAQSTHATLGYLTDGANAAGGWMAGALPEQGSVGKKNGTPGLNARKMLEKSLKSYLLLNIEPEMDCANSAAAVKALKNANFVVALTSFNSVGFENYAHVMLPIAPFTENPGTFINVEGLWQRFEAVGPCLGEARPAWKILRVLGNLFELENFDYTHAHEILAELEPLADALPKVSPEIQFPEELPSVAEAIYRMSEWQMYRTDPLVRRSQPLQNTIDPEILAIRMNAELAQRYNFVEGQEILISQQGTKITLPLMIDNRIPANNVLIAAGIGPTAGFGTTFGEVELRSAQRA